MENISKKQLDSLHAEILATVKDLDISAKQSRKGELETKSMETDFWNDQNSAKLVMSEIDALKTEITEAEYLESTINSLIEIFDSVEEKERESLQSDYEDLYNRYQKFQTLTYLSGKYDKNSAVLSIHSGQGGTEANDWTEMLLRMYQRYAENKGWVVQVQNMVPGTEAGLSSVTMTIEGIYVFGLLQNENGTHRLVRQSPFNAQNLRQTSFAGVEVLPIIDDTDDSIQIADTDLEFKAVKAGGAGGQHVNKTSTAVQLTHIPSGITVHNSESRNQTQNRENAMKILKAKLWKIEEEKRQKEMSDLKGEYKIAGWGNQIRNYVLHPYKLVKDLRSKVESSDPEAVLDGDLDQFIDAGVRIR